MRKYEAIWIALKRDKHASIVAELNLHRRIVAGVIREKFSDLGWKFQSFQGGTKSKLYYECCTKTGIIKFRLEVTIDPRNI